MAETEEPIAARSHVSGHGVSAG